MARSASLSPILQNEPKSDSTPNPPAAILDSERVRAAITLALDAALPTLVEEITERVLIALGH